MNFRVVLLSNGKYKKTLYRCGLKKNAYLHFHELKKQNEKVLFPRRFVNTNGIFPVKYEIAITKPTEEGDEFRILRDDLGRLYTEEPLQDWTILHSAKFELEEKFWIYGRDPKKNRKNISEIVKRIMVGVQSKKNVKQIIVLNNKVVIYNEEFFEMVLCKNPEDAKRLHDTLAKIAHRQKMDNLMFMGHASPVMSGVIVDLIKEKTGWTLIKIWRHNTRP